MMSDLPSRPDNFANWFSLRNFTGARIALGRAGCGLPVKAHLEFQAAHARARDAVHAELHVEDVKNDIISCGWPVRTVQSAAPNRQVFLQRPDLGRLLSEESKAQLSAPMIAPDLVFILGDGLSSVAVERNACPILKILWPQLVRSGFRMAPVILAAQARVALADHIGELLQAKLSIMMIGERPGLSAADSLGLYLTYQPRVGRVDSERNCISNIHAKGMNATDAATQTLQLIKSIFSTGASGVRLSAARDALRPLP
jgi:ethanolamine ammonia-lyase small subunit